MIKSQHGDQPIKIEALEVPNICTIASTPVSKEIVHAMTSKCQVAADASLTATFQEHQGSVLME